MSAISAVALNTISWSWSCDSDVSLACLWFLICSSAGLTKFPNDLLGYSRCDTISASSSSTVSSRLRPKPRLSLWAAPLGKVALTGEGLSRSFGAVVTVATLLSCHFFGTRTHNGVLSSPYLFLRIERAGLWGWPRRKEGLLGGASREGL